MPKLQFIDHTHEDSVQAFHDFRNTCSYKTDESAEIHFLLNPLDLTMTLCCDPDLLYLTFMNCIMCLFHHPELWKDHIVLRDIYSNYSSNCMSDDFMKHFL